MPYAQINGAKIYYEDEGHGEEAVFFGHGILLNHHLFDDQVAALKQDYRCIRWDFRGHGQSEVTDDGYELLEQAADVVALADHLGIERFHYAGLSMGGFIGIRLGIHFGDRLKSLILIDTTSQPKSAIDRIKLSITDIVIRQSGIKPWVNFVMETYFGKTFCGDEKRRKHYDQWCEYIGKVDPEGAVKANKVVTHREDITDQLHRIEVPTLIVVGDEDVLTPPGHARLMADNIPHSKVVVIPYAGHCSTVEQPKDVNQALEQFLRNPSAVAASDPMIVDISQRKQLDPERE